MEIRDKKGDGNLAADHLSRLENPHEEEKQDIDIDDAFPEEGLYMLDKVSDPGTPWFVDFANYLVAKVLPQDFTPQQRRNSSLS